MTIQNIKEENAEQIVVLVYLLLCGDVSQYRNPEQEAAIWSSFFNLILKNCVALRPKYLCVQKHMAINSTDMLCSAYFNRPNSDLPAWPLSGSKFKNQF